MIFCATSRYITISRNVEQQAQTIPDRNTNATKKHEVIQIVHGTYAELTNDHEQIIITWISSHQGIGRNEKAKEATTDRTTHLNTTPRPISFNDQSGKRRMEQNLNYDK